MAAFTAILGAASLALGAAGHIASEKARKKSEAAALAATRKAEIEAKEAAALKGQDAVDPRVKIGSVDDDEKKVAETAKGTASRKTTTGVGLPGVSASSIGGL